MPSRTYRILAVNDILDNLVLLQTLLELEGYVVDVATSGKLALSKIAATVPDLVLLDVRMPDTNGFEVIQHIRQNQQFPAMPILLVTADNEVSAVEGIEIGANDFIRKPIDPDDLLVRIRTFLQLEHQFSSEASNTSTSTQTAISNQI